MNEPPADHLLAGLAEAFQVEPLDTLGNVDASNGWIVLSSIGMCNTSLEFATFMPLAIGFPGRNPRVRLVNGAQGGWTAVEIADPESPFWDTVDAKLRNQNLHPNQLQVVWFLEANANPTEPFPVHADSLEAQFGRAMNVIRARYPNVRLAYVSSRIYAGYACSTLNPEPYAYESGFAVKWLIENQVEGNSELNYDPDAGVVNAPWLAWGPYLWADGTTGNSDSLVWVCSDFNPNDGTHPAEGARVKVANRLLDFFTTNATATPWFLNSSSGAPAVSPESSLLGVHLPQPNPFRDETRVSIDVFEERPLRVDIVTISGRRLKTLANRSFAVGRWTISWDGSDSDGVPVGPGVYFFQVRTGDIVVRSLKATRIQ
jgi:hypothetical protein